MWLQDWRLSTKSINGGLKVLKTQSQRWSAWPGCLLRRRTQREALRSTLDWLTAIISSGSVLLIASFNYNWRYRQRGTTSEQSEPTQTGMFPTCDWRADVSHRGASTRQNRSIGELLMQDPSAALPMMNWVRCSSELEDWRRQKRLSLMDSRLLQKLIRSLCSRLWQRYTGNNKGQLSSSMSAINVSTC